jgi:hypothetical protein
MAAATLKIKLHPLVPIWSDPDNGIFLQQGMVFDCAKVTDFDAIREGLKKNNLVIVEGELPAEGKDAVEARVTVLETKVTTLESKVSELGTKVSEVEGKINTGTE